MLKEHFAEVWFAGELDEESVKKLREKMTSVLKKGGRRIRFRFYLKNRKDTRYFDALRKLLLENTTLTIVIEDENIDKLPEDARKTGGQVVLIANNLSSEILNIVKGMCPRIEEVKAG